MNDIKRKVLFGKLRKVNNIPQCKELHILGVKTFQENCKYREHVRAKLIKANIKVSVCIKVLTDGRFQSRWVDRLFSALVSPNFGDGLTVFGAVDSDLTVIQNFLDTV